MHDQNIIREKILVFYRRKTAYILLAGIFHLLLFWSVVWLSTFAADSVFFFSEAFRWFVLVVNGGFSLFLLYIFIGRQLQQFFDRRRRPAVLTDTAREIGSLMPEIGDRLVNAFQLQQTNESYSSPDLRRHAIDRFSDSIRDKDFRKLLSLRTYFMPITSIAAIVAGAVILTVFMGDQLSVSLKRIFNPTGTYHLVQEYRFKVVPGDTLLIAGTPLNVTAEFTGPVVDQLRLEIQTVQGGEMQTLQPEKKGREFSATIPGMRTDYHYQMVAIPVWDVGEAQVLRSQEFMVEVVVPPTVNDLQVAVIPPAYTRLGKILLEPNTGDIQAYRGSKIEWSARLNKDVRSAEIVFASGDKIPARIRGRSVSGDFLIEGSGAYRIDLMDERQIRNTDPISYQIEVLEDLVPTISLIEPGQDVDISPDAALNLLFEGRDDFGFTRLWLSYQVITSLTSVSDTTWFRIPLSVPAGQDKFFQQQFLWRFNDIAVGFGDVIRYYLSLSDNDRIRGPKTGVTGIYQINFPTIEQVFAASDQKQQESIDENELISEESEQLRQDLEQITREMKRDKEIDWERQKQIESALNKQKDIQEKLDRISKNLDEAIRKLDQSQMISPETLEKYQQLQQLFQEIATPELLEAMKDLASALEKMDDKEIEKSLQEFKLNQEKFAAEVERTLELFKKVRFEQELDRLTKIAEKALRDQEKVSEDLTEQFNPEMQMKEQQRQNELLGNMEKNLDELLKNDLLPRYPEAQKQLNQSSDLMKTDQFRKLSEQIMDQLRSENQTEAIVKSNDLAGNLEQLSAQISQAKKKILDSDRQNISAQLRKSGANLLDLSRQQEDLMDKTADAGSLSDRFKDLAGEQQQIAQNMNRVIEDMVKLSRETFMLSPEIGQSMQAAGQGMGKSLNELENRNKSGAGNAQKQAMGALNKAVLELQSTMQNMASSGSALGFEQFMERMQQMSGQQGQLNEQGINFMQGPGKNPGMLSPEAQQQLRRMAGEQRALQESMEELQGEMGQKSDILGRLDNIAAEMENVVKDMELMQMDRKTVERQQRILTRMLDAQKSMREQEYSRQRQAETGKDYFRRPPDSRQEREDLELKRLQDELIRALQEGYNPDYEKIIEEYYRILSQKYLEEKSLKP